MSEETEEEWRKSWLERFRISPYIDWVRTPQFKSKKEKIKAKVKCFLYGHLYEYNGDKLTLGKSLMKLKNNMVNILNHLKFLEV